MVHLLAVACISFSAAFGAKSHSVWTDVTAADRTLMGDYEGEWINPPAKSYQRGNPRLYAQVINIGEGKHRLNFTPDHNRRAVILNSIEATVEGDAIVAEDGDWNIRVTKSGLTGTGTTRGNPLDFSLQRVTRGSPTMGAKAPQGALTLFDGNDFSGMGTPRWPSRDVDASGRPGNGDQSGEGKQGSGPYRGW